jgi:hypothetical protein
MVTDRLRARVKASAEKSFMVPSIQKVLKITPSVRVAGELKKRMMIDNLS